MKAERILVAMGVLALFVIASCTDSDTVNTGGGATDDTDVDLGRLPTANYSWSSSLYTYPAAANGDKGGVVDTYITFKNLSQAGDSPITYFLWLFPESSMPSSTEWNPKPIKYNTVGTYTISLTVSNRAGAHTAPMVLYIDNL